MNNKEYLNKLPNQRFDQLYSLVSGKTHEEIRKRREAIMEVGNALNPIISLFKKWDEEIKCNPDVSQKEVVENASRKTLAFAMLFEGFNREAQLIILRTLIKELENRDKILDNVANAMKKFEDGKN